MNQVRAAVAIITYRRPEGLAALLTSIANMVVETPFRVIVVDNDADGSAREIIAASEIACRIHYAVEPRPGIPAARNRCLDLMHPDDDVIVFVDDDEVVSTRWLDELVTAWKYHEVEIVSGPVLSVFAPDAPGWIVRGGYIQRRVYAEGSPEGIPATNNTLVARELLVRSGVRFDEKLAFTGGSDSHFFNTLIREHGARFCWTEAAAVSESVPAERATPAWIWRRSIRNGNVRAELLLRRSRRLSVVLAGLARVLSVFVRVPASVVRGKKLTAREVLPLPVGLGMISAATSGRRVQEYSRR